VVLQFTISAAGAVTEAKIASSTLGDAEVEACMVGRVRTWAFPTGAGPVQVNYPFTMRPPGSP